MSESDQLAGIQRAIGKLQGTVEGLGHSLGAHRDEVTRANAALHQRITAEVGKVAAIAEVNRGDIGVLKAEAAGERAVGAFKRGLGYMLSGSFGAAALELIRWATHLGDQP